MSQSALKPGAQQRQPKKKVIRSNMRTHDKRHFACFLAGQATGMSRGRQALSALAPAPVLPAWSPAATPRRDKETASGWTKCYSRRSNLSRLLALAPLQRALVSFRQHNDPDASAIPDLRSLSSSACILFDTELREPGATCGASGANQESLQDDGLAIAHVNFCY